MNAERGQEIYMEKQKKYSNHCGVHALNNLLGRNVFSSGDLDRVIKKNKASLISPKHILGGDYDISVLMLALGDEGYEVCWLDNRKKDEICLSFTTTAARRNVLGYLINKDVRDSRFSHSLKTFFGFSGKHWFSVKHKDGKYWLLDSRHQQCEEIPSISTFLAIEMEKGSHVLEVYDGEKKECMADTMDSND